MMSVYIYIMPVASKSWMSSHRESRVRPGLVWSGGASCHQLAASLAGRLPCARIASQPSQWYGQYLRLHSSGSLACGRPTADRLSSLTANISRQPTVFTESSSEWEVTRSDKNNGSRKLELGEKTDGVNSSMLISGKRYFVVCSQVLSSGTGNAQED
jgi:hypothetical protein